MCVSDVRERPEWLRVRSPAESSEFSETLRIIRENRIRTVCEEANCPNIGECWREKTATFLILGDVCTRNCGFCDIKSGCPRPINTSEVTDIARAVRELGVRYSVITSVTRDDLPDSGASHFAAVIRRIKEDNHDVLVEVLTPDFLRDVRGGIEAVLRAGPDVFGHNLEVVRRLHDKVKSHPSRFAVSLDFLRTIKELAPDVLSKTGIMVGVGEEKREVLELIDEAADAGVDILTIGQYLPPSNGHYPIARYVEPAEFAEYKLYGEEGRIKVVESGPFVRSSYRAFAAFRKAKL
jgi:lipoic acid synthetase